MGEAIYFELPVLSVIILAFLLLRVGRSEKGKSRQQLTWLLVFAMLLCVIECAMISTSLYGEWFHGSTIAFNIVYYLVLSILTCFSFRYSLVYLSTDDKGSRKVLMGCSDHVSFFPLVIEFIIIIKGIYSGELSHRFMVGGTPDAYSIALYLMFVAYFGGVLAIIKQLLRGAGDRLRLISAMKILVFNLIPLLMNGLDLVWPERHMAIMGYLISCLFIIGTRYWQCSVTAEQTINSVEFDRLKRLACFNDDFNTIIEVNLDTEQCLVLQVKSDMEWMVNYATSRGYEYYCRFMVAEYAHPDDRAAIEKFLKPETLIKLTEKNNTVFLNYRVVSGGRTIYYQTKAVLVDSTPGQRTVLLGGHNTDQDTRREMKRVEYLAVINGLAVDFDYVSFINANTEQEIQYRVGDAMASQVAGWRLETSYSKRMEILANSIIVPEDRDRFRRESSLRNLTATLEKNMLFFINCRLAFEDGIRYYQFKYVADWDDNGKVQGFLFGMHDVDNETKKGMEQEAQLAEAILLAESASAAKSDFLSRMSHDIRTPINGVMGMTEIALKHLDDREKVEYCLNKINQSSHHLNSLINDVLDLSKIESGSTEIRSTPMNINAFLDECCSIVEGQILNRGLEFTSETDAFDHENVLADGLHLRQIMINILGNAIKFTRDGGWVRLRTRNLGEDEYYVNIAFEVEDNGIGMKPEYLEHIWDAFSQENEEVHSQYAGTGLGMAITKKLVTMMEGDVSVESELGKGSKFTVKLRLQVNPDITEEKQIGTVGNLKGCRVLVAEDNDLNMEIALELLADEGIETVAAANGKIAVAEYLNHEPGYFDAILMDIMMPEMDGLEATRLIRRLDRHDSKTIPIIAMTANAFDDDVHSTASAGMNEHLSKPIGAPRLGAVLRQFIGR